MFTLMANISMPSQESQIASFMVKQEGEWSHQIIRILSATWCQRIVWRKSVFFPAKHVDWKAAKLKVSHIFPLLLLLLLSSSLVLLPMLRDVALHCRNTSVSLRRCGWDSSSIRYLLVLSVYTSLSYWCIRCDSCGLGFGIPQCTAASMAKSILFNIDVTIIFQSRNVPSMETPVSAAALKIENWQLSLCL